MATEARDYLTQHNVETKLMEAIRMVTKERPLDPIMAIGQHLINGGGCDISDATETSKSGSLKAVTWNIAAINNNPFEYWLTHPDANYEVLMKDVQDFVEAPGDKDCTVGSVFTPGMFEELTALMDAQGWEAAEPCAAAFAELAERKIISGFLKDAGLGNKRLMSMPDRMTNTIDVAGGGFAYRPSVISSFDGDMATVATWWAAWKDFHFLAPLTLPVKGGSTQAKLPCQLLSKIPRSKYPALSEEEEAMSLRLQTLCLAIFDAVLVHMLNVVSPSGEWLQLKRGILDALLHKKEARTVGILQAPPFMDSDVIFLQEVRTTNGLAAALANDYACVTPNPPSKADQNSVILLRKSRFGPSVAAEDVTAAARALWPKDGAKISDGDLLVIKAPDAHGNKFLLASFHGDTDGLGTSPTVAAVCALAATLPDYTVVFGLDANTYQKPKAGKQAGVATFLEEVANHGYAASCGSSTEVRTTFCARTYLQPQLQKACKANEKKSKGDYNSKDYILFSSSSMAVSNYGAANTVTGAHDQEMVIPTLEWPSDHSLLHTTFTLKK